MSSSRYERIPQLDDSISLNTVTNDDLDIPNVTPADSSYNYNSGVPTSPPPSFRSRNSSIAAPFPAISTFHSAPLNNHASRATNSNNNSAAFTTSEFSTVLLTPGSSERRVTEDANGSDTGDEGSEALIRAMSKRIERLEESIGRLLMEKHSHSAGADMPASHPRCCTSFSMSENPNDPENVPRPGDCCVTIRARKDILTTTEKLALMRIKAFFCLMIMIIVWTVLMKALDMKGKGPGPDKS